MEVSWDDLMNKNNSWGVEEPQEIEQPTKEEKKRGSARRTTECSEFTTKYEYRRAFSELQLINLDVEFTPNTAINFLTGGDVDSLSFLKLVLRKAKKLDYLLLSTWCMAAEDILQLTKWVEEGTIKHLDFYVGEIFPNSYHIEYAMIKKLIRETECGRVAVFKNHSKIFAGQCEAFDFSIQSSANINTNPRCENACIQIYEKREDGNNGFYFYKDFFDKIVSFDKND